MDNLVRTHVPTARKESILPFARFIRPPFQLIILQWDHPPELFDDPEIKIATVNEQHAWGMKKLMRNHDVKLVAIAVLKHFSKFSSTSQHSKKSLRTVGFQHWKTVLRTFKKYAEDDLVVGRWGHTL